MHTETKPLHTLLREIREERGLTLTEVADRINTSASNIAHWERGINEPRITSVERWASILGYELELMLKE